VSVGRWVWSEGRKQCDGVQRRRQGEVVCRKLRSEKRRGVKTKKTSGDGGVSESPPGG